MTSVARSRQLGWLSEKREQMKCLFSSSYIRVVLFVYLWTLGITATKILLEPQISKENIDQHPEKDLQEM